MTGRTAYSRALSAFDVDAIIASLSDKITFRVAVHDEPLQGKATASFCSASSPKSWCHSS